MSTGLYNYQEGLAHPDWEAEWHKQGSEAEEYGFQSFVYRSDRGFDSQAFERFLHNWPKGVIRAKGWVKFVDQAPVAFSQAGKQIVLEPRIELLHEHELRALPQEEQAHCLAILEAIQQEPTEMVFIGQGLLRQQREIIQQLEACLG